MTWKAKGLVAAAGALALTGSFIAGRYSRPAEVRETVKIETKWSVHVAWFLQRVTKEAKHERRNVRIVRVEVPGGATTTTTTDTTEVDTSTESATIASSVIDHHGSSDTEASTVATTEQPRLRLGVGVGADFRDGIQLAGDITAGYRLLGPLRVEGTVSKQLDGKVSYGARIKAEVEF